MIENNFNIGEIVIYQKAHCYCQLGEDWYTNNFRIEIKVDKKIPDYCEVDKFIKNKIENAHLIIEEACKAVLDYFINELNPLQVVVESTVEDAAHCAVKIKAWWSREH